MKVIAGKTGGARRLKVRRASQWLTVAPALIIIFAIMIYPLLYNFYISFRYVTLANLKKGGVFIGIDNYITLLQDETFRGTLLITLRYVVVTVVLQIALAFMLALATYRGRRVLRGLVTICLLLPKMITPAASALIWRFILNYETGVINYFLSSLGLKKVAFLTDAGTAMATLNVIGVWQNIGFSFLLIIAALMGLPHEVMEASMVDGATYFKRIRYIVLPHLKNVMMVVCLFAVINAFQTFDSIYMTTNGGPAELTQVASIYLYRKLFTSSQMGEAAAISVILLLISLLISFVMTLMLRRKDHE